MEAMKKEVTLVPMAAKTQEAAQIPPDDYAAMFEYAWQKLSEKYFDKTYNGRNWAAVHDKYAAEAASATSNEEWADVIDRLLAELDDPQTFLARPEPVSAIYNILRRSPLFVEEAFGLLVFPAREDEQLFVWDVCPDSPAGKAGIEPGNVILNINDEDIIRSSAGFDPIAINNLFYRRGRTLDLTLRDMPEAAPQKVELHNDPQAGFTCNAWKYGWLSKSPPIAYIRIPDFDPNPADNLKILLNIFEKETPLAGLVLDVRRNPGQLNYRAGDTQTAALFTHGELFPGYLVRGPVGWNEKTPLVILIDGGTREAAEYFVYALQHSGRATLVGMPTAGWVNISEQVLMPNNALLVISTKTLVDDQGESLMRRGVEPDVRIRLSVSSFGDKPDPQLQMALTVLLTKIRPEG